MPAAPLPPLLAAPLEAAWLRARPSAGAAPRLAIAVSGGPDSVALAAATAALAPAWGASVVLLHIDHGLQAVARQWAEGVLALAQALGVDVQRQQVQVPESAQRIQGVEAAARDARYAALARLAHREGATAVWLAHHQDDQAETILLQALRGTGLAGLRGMAAQTQRDGVDYQRPWLSVPRAAILAYAESLSTALNLPLADDPTNLDPRYARGVLRTQVLPAIASFWPGYRQTLTRLGQHADEALTLLDDYSADDEARVFDDVANKCAAPGVASLASPGPELEAVAAALPGPALRLAAWRALPDLRRTVALRRWLARCELPMPSRARLADWQRQLQQVGTDQQLSVSYAGRVLRVHGGRAQWWWAAASAVPSQPVAAGAAASRESVADGPTLAWTPGTTWLALPALGGGLRIAETAHTLGADPAWLRQQSLQALPRQGGERWRTAPDRASRPLKQAYQTAGVPFWARQGQPVLWVDGRVVWVGGLGWDASVPQVLGGVQMVWVVSEALDVDRH